MSELDKFVKLLAQTDGRDKIYKAGVSLCKILAWYHEADKATAKKWSGLAKAVGEGRSLMRMGKWCGNYAKLQGFAAKAGTLTQRQVVEILRVIGDFGYVFGDNLQYLSKYAVLPFDAKKCQKNSKVFQFWGYICAVLLDVWSLMNLGAKNLEPKELKKERKALLLSFVKNFSDLMATLAAVGYLEAYYKPHTAVNASFGLVSGSIATYTNWKKIK